MGRTKFSFTPIRLFFGFFICYLLAFGSRDHLEPLFMVLLGLGILLELGFWMSLFIDPPAKLDMDD